MARAKSMSRAADFSCKAPNATSVFVAGTFNDWRTDATPLFQRKPGGEWTGSLPLPPGRHEYKFVVDGQWCCEPGCEGAHGACPNCVPNAFGTMNRFVEVPEVS